MMGAIWVEKAGKLGDETDITPLIVYNGDIHAGTKPHGLLYRYDKTAGAWVQVASQYASETGISDLLLKDGDLYALSQPSRHLLKYVPGTGWQKVADGVPDYYIYKLGVYKGKFYTAIYSATFSMNYFGYLDEANVWRAAKYGLYSTTTSGTRPYCFLIKNDKFYSAGGLDNNVGDNDGAFKWITNSIDPPYFDELNGTYGVDVRDGKLYVVDRGMERIVFADAADLSFQAVFDTEGYCDHQIKYPLGIHVDDTYLYHFKRDEYFGSHVLHKRQLSDLVSVANAASYDSINWNFPEAISGDGTHLFITDTENSRIVKLLKSDLSCVAYIGSQGAGDDQFNKPWGIACDDTYIYVADTYNHRIVKRLKSTLAYVSKIGSQGSGDNQFKYPRGVCCDGTYLYVADTGNSRLVKRLKSDLSYVSKIGSLGSGDNQFNWLFPIATDGTYLYIGDEGNWRVVKRKNADLSFVAKNGVMFTYSSSGGPYSKILSNNVENPVRAMINFEDVIYFTGGMKLNGYTGGALYKVNDNDNNVSQVVPSRGLNKKNYCLLAFNSELYTGTNDYALLRFDGVSAWEIVANRLAGGALGEQHILSLVEYDDGSGLNIWAGTAPNGKLYTLGSEGAVSKGGFPFPDKPAFRYEVYKGLALDSFGSFVDLPYQSTRVMADVWDNAVDIELTKSGGESSIRWEQFDQFIESMSCIGFRVKNSTPGKTGRYELVMFR